MTTITITSPPNARTNGTGLRTYTWRGQELPSVTSVQKMAGLPHGLHQWAISRVVERATLEHETLAAMLTRERKPRERVLESNRIAEASRWLRSAATEQRDMAAAVGSAVHDAASAGITPDSIPDVLDTIKDGKPITVDGISVRNRLTQFHDWLRVSRAEVLAQEFQVFNLCTVVGTRTLTRDLRWVPVDSLSVGDELWAFSEHAGGQGHPRSWEPSIVTGTGISEAECVRVTLASGVELISTLDHPYLAQHLKGGEHHKTLWVKAEDLRAGDVLPKYLDPWEADRSYEAGWLAGMFDGEGCLIARPDKNTYSLFISQNVGLTWDAIRVALAARGIRWGESYHHRVKSNGKPTTMGNAKIAGGVREVAAVLGSIRPGRLLPGFVGPARLQTGVYDPVVSVQHVGRRLVVNLSTSSKTYFSEGYGSHNTVGYGGQADLLVRFPSGRVALVDLKTGSSVHTEHAVQLRAYREAEFVGRDDVIDEDLTVLLLTSTDLGILHLAEDHWEYIALQDDASAGDAFRGLTAYATWMAAHADAETSVTGRRTNRVCPVCTETLLAPDAKERMMVTGRIWTHLRCIPGEAVAA